MKKASPHGFTLALIQTPGDCDRDDRFAPLVADIRAAASQGAQVVVLPELFLNPYFCIEEDIRHFDLAHGLDHPRLRALSELARESELVIVAPFYERRGAGIYHNSAAVYDADGSLAGLYRKMHIPDDPGFYEKYYFIPGDRGFQAIPTRYGKIGVLICWDQWFPEGARLTALRGADVLVYPTAIGWDDKELAAAPDAPALRRKQLDGWVTMHRAHAIANNVYVAAVNRTGQEGHLRFWGNSLACDPGGEVVGNMDDTQRGPLLAEVKRGEIEMARRVWPFLRDRRVDAYGDLGKRWAE